MTIRKLIMIEPKAPSCHVFSMVRLPRLGLPILGTIAHRRGIEVHVVIEEMTPVNFEQISGADLLCLSTITSTAPSAYRVADRARAAGVPVIMGGPHVTFFPEEALGHADWVLRGEGERSFSLFLDVLEGRLDPAAVPALSYWQDGRMVHNPAAIEQIDLDEVPIPDFSLLESRGPRRFDRGIIPIQTSRGCPHRCNFCSVTPIFGHQMRFASNEHVAEGLERRRGMGREVFFYDDNFCGSPARTKSLLDHLLSRDVFLPPWMAQVSVRAAQDLELLRLMQRAGCAMVFVGFESVNPDSLAHYHKRQTVADIRLAIKRFQQHGIWVHGMFMTGSDRDTVESIRATRRFAIAEDIDTIQFLVLTPLPGTPVYDEMDQAGRLLNRNWELYDAHHTVFQPAQMSPAELTKETLKAMGKVYSLGRVAKLVARGKFDRAVFSLYARRQVQRKRREHRQYEKASRKVAAWPLPVPAPSPAPTLIANRG